MTTTPGWAEPLPYHSAAPGWSTIDAERLTAVSLGGLQLLTTARQVLEAEPYAISLRDISGWKGPARDATEVLPHWGGDGTVSLLQRYGARSITLRGTIQARTAGAATLAEEALSSFQVGLLRVAEAGTSGPREADVRLTDASPERRSPEFIEWSISLTADDPYRYGSGTRALTNGQNSIPNRGNTGVNPVLDLTGPHGPLTITHPGGTYTLAAIGPSQVRTLDWRNGDVWAGNTRQFGVEGGRRPIVLRGGSTWTVSGLGAGSATLRRFEAWT